MLSVFTNTVIHNEFLGATEFALSITLVVFVMLTVILAALLIALGASKNFRTVFFRESKKRKRTVKKQDASAQPDPEPTISDVSAAQRQTPQARAADEIETEPRQTAKTTAARTASATPRRRSQKKETDYLDGVPTVPLNIAPPPAPPRSAQSGRKRQAFDPTDNVTAAMPQIKTVPTPKRGTAGSQKAEQTANTYTARPITIARASGSDPTQSKRRRGANGAESADNKPSETR